MIWSLLTSTGKINVTKDRQINDQYIIILEHPRITYAKKSNSLPLFLNTHFL